MFRLIQNWVRLHPRVAFTLKADQESSATTAYLNRTSQSKSSQAWRTWFRAEANEANSKAPGLMSSSQFIATNPNESASKHTFIFKLNIINHLWFRLRCSLHIEDSVHWSGINHLVFCATKAQSIRLEAALCIFHQGKSLLFGRTHQWDQAFQTKLSGDGAPVWTLSEGLELLQPGHGGGIIVLTGRSGSRLLIPHKGQSPIVVTDTL